MKHKDNTILAKRKRNIQQRLQRHQTRRQNQTVFAGANLQFEMADRVRAVPCGGVAAIHHMVRQLGLDRNINTAVQLLKQHKPYLDSDHVLNMTYNIMAGGVCLDDIELLRNDEMYLDAIGAGRIPDPTTAGDYLRRFQERDIVGLMEAINALRPKLWDARLSFQQRAQAIIDMDGTLVPLGGKCREGADMSYACGFSYHPLLVSLANTGEPLYLENRPGNRPSYEGVGRWVDRSVKLVRQSFGSVCLRGDTDFSLTENFARWTDDDVDFIFGYDAMANMVKRAVSLDKSAWQPLKRSAKHDPKPTSRKRPRNVKKQVVIKHEYKNLETKGEHIAEFSYRPVKCDRDYRVIVLKKDIEESKGQQVLFETERFFFYITNISDKTATELMHFYRKRCNQENLIEQLKNGVHAMWMPTGDLVSNWAYMVIASLAWTLKAWYALHARLKKTRAALLKMEFRQFLNAIMRIPCQVVRTGRRLVLRILNYTMWTRTFLSTHRRIRELCFP